MSSLTNPVLWLKPTRTPVRKSGVAFTGRYFEPDTGKMHIGESRIEHNANFHFQANPDIVRCISHPATFGYIGPDGRERQYSPDKLLICRTGHFVWMEAKPWLVTFKKTYILEFNYLQRLFRSVGWDLIHVVDKHVNREPYLGNLKLIQGYRKLRLNAVDCECIVQYVRENPGATIAEVQNLAAHKTLPQRSHFSCCRHEAYAAI